jgi:hypothetical protein
MKHSEKNEFDLMLRALAKRERALEEDQNDAAHLDTDELNAYAEDVLPSATRARYTAHIVDCATCRRIVSQLAVSAGAAAQLAAPAKPVRSFWATVAEFFSPAVLKYGAPALAFIAIGIVGFVVWNNQRKTEFVAQNQTPATAVPQPSERVNVDTPREEKLDNYVEKPRADESRKQSPGRAGVEQDRTTASTDSSVAANERQQSAKTPAAQPQYAPEPSTAAAPPPKPATTEANKNEPVGKGEVRAQEDQERKRRDEAEVTRSKEVGQVSKGEYSKGEYSKGAPDKDSGSKTDSSKPGAVGGVSTRTMRDTKGKKGEYEEPETRSVSGKQFRQEGSTWVDTSYDSSRATVNIKRGSEQYRALIADEPAIKNIAESLSGTVIVVWKGRTYRIY